MRMREIVVLAGVAGIAVLAVIGVAIAGCGDEFKEQAEQACREGRVQLETIEKTARSPAEQVARSATVVERTRARLAKLNPPSGDRDAFDRYLRALDRLIVLEPRVATAIKDGDIGQAQRLGPRVNRADRMAKGAAAEAGLGECAK